MRFKFFVAWLVLLTCVASLPTVATAQINTISDPLVAGTEYNRYRIPGFTVANDGSLLLFAEGRPSGADPGGAGDIDLVFKRSVDGGETWSSLSVLHRRSGFDFSDPRVVVDSASGKVHLQYVQWPTLVGQANSSLATGFGDDSAKIYYQTSDDHGASWSGPADITPQVKDINWAAINTGPGLGIQLKWQTTAQGGHNGRLLMPAHKRPNQYEGVALYSDNNGVSWNHTEDSSNGGQPTGFTDESEVIELTDGRLMWDGRQGGGSSRNRYFSSDGGETWGGAISGDIPVTPVDTGLLRYSAKREGNDRDRILYSSPLGSNLGAGNNRENIGIWTSYDEGKTFINPVQIQSGSAAYSVIDKLDDGSVGLIYEIGSATAVRYVNFDLAQLEGARQQAETTHYDGFDNTIARDRGGIGWSGKWETTNGTPDFTGDNNANFGNGSSVTFDNFKFDKRDGRLDLFRAQSGGQFVERDLAQTIDLNSNGTHYASLLVSNRLDNSADSNTNEFLDIEFLDGNGDSQAAFGVGSGEAFFVTGLGSNSRSTADDSLVRDEDYFLVAKIVSQDDSNGSNFDQIFLKVYESGDFIPDSDDGLNWTLAGLMNENSDALLESISLGGGEFVTWSLDELRIGSTWGSVASNVSSVPEPASAVLISAFALGLAFRRRRDF